MFTMMLMTESMFLAFLARKTSLLINVFVDLLEDGRERVDFSMCSVLYSLHQSTWPFHPLTILVQEPIWWALFVLVELNLQCPRRTHYPLRHVQKQMLANPLASINSVAVLARPSDTRNALPISTISSARCSKSFYATHDATAEI